MIEIRYNTRIFIDPKTKHIKIRVRWNKNETTFSLKHRADPDKWDGKAQRPVSGTIHKFADQNNSARILSIAIEDSLDQIKAAFRQCELDSMVPSKETLKTMVRNEQPKEDKTLVKKTLAELYEEYQESKRDDRNLMKTSCYKYMQVWNHLIECHPGITLEDLTKEKLHKLKSWYINRGYSNIVATIPQFSTAHFASFILCSMNAYPYSFIPTLSSFSTN